MKRTLFLTFFALSLQAEQAWTHLKSDEEIIFYPSIAHRVKGKTILWRAEIRGSVFEPERRRLMVAAFREAVELRSDDMTSAEAEVFSKRARLFLVDHERGKKVFIRLGTNEFFVGKSGTDGRFAGEVTFTNASATSFVAILGAGDKREFRGRIFPMEAEGVSVISDIDDTIKITEVRNRKATLRNTFMREFEAVPDMAQFYLTATNEPNVSFHYVSASPWQLYEPLAALVVSNDFPAGTFELKEFRWKSKSFLSLFSNPEKYKPGVIEPLLKQFPKRTFILVGDSGERDPEIYGTLARKYPEQILRILIRDVTSESPEADRYQKAFRDMPRETWQIFREPSEIKCLCE